MNSNKKVDKQNKKTGRRPKNCGPALPRDEVDKLLVHGEAVEQGEDMSSYINYPSFREIAQRYGVSHSLVAKYSKQHNCLQRRKQTQKRTHEMADTKLAEFRADELAIKKDDVVRAIDRFLVQFEQSIAEGRVRCDNPSDYNTMVRLRAYVVGDADLRAELIGDVSLEELERRHKEMLESWNKSSSEMRGEVIKMPTVETDSKDEKSDTAN